MFPGIKQLHPIEGMDCWLNLLYAKGISHTSGHVPRLVFDILTEPYKPGFVAKEQVEQEERKIENIVAQRYSFVS